MHGSRRRRRADDFPGVFLDLFPASDFSTVIWQIRLTDTEQLRVGEIGDGEATKEHGRGASRLVSEGWIVADSLVRLDEVLLEEKGQPAIAVQSSRLLNGDEIDF